MKNTATHNGNNKRTTTITTEVVSTRWQSWLSKATSLSMGLLLATNTWAADASFCDNYARKAIQQQITNIAQGCGQTGLRWSPLYVGQQQWCLTVRQGIAQAETQARETALQSCGTQSTSPIDWRNLPNIPWVWDQLFAQGMQALANDDATSIEVMHKHGMNIHHDEGFNNGTLLYHAIGQQALNVSRYLLQQSVDPNRTTNGGQNPLNTMFERYDPQQRKYVSTQANTELLQLLLNYGANPNTFGERGGGDLPLDLAINNKQWDAATLLLSAGADPNLHDFGQDPLLIRTITNGDVSAVTLLVNRGADVNRGRYEQSCKDKPENDETLPLDIALKQNQQAIAQLLKHRGAKTAAECRTP